MRGFLRTKLLRLSSNNYSTNPEKKRKKENHQVARSEQDMLGLWELTVVKPLEKTLEEWCWRILISIRSATSPGCEISRSWMSISFVNILITVDISGRNLAVSCTHRRPTFINWIASFSGKFISSIGSTNCKCLLELWACHAYTYMLIHQAKTTCIIFNNLRQKLEHSLRAVVTFWTR